MSGTSMRNFSYSERVCRNVVDLTWNYPYVVLASFNKLGQWNWKCGTSC